MMGRSRVGNRQTVKQCCPLGSGVMMSTGGSSRDDFLFLSSSAALLRRRPFESERGVRRYGVSEKWRIYRLFFFSQQTTAAPVFSCPFYRGVRFCVYTGLFNP